MIVHALGKGALDFDFGEHDGGHGLVGREFVGLLGDDFGFFKSPLVHKVLVLVDQIGQLLLLHSEIFGLLVSLSDYAVIFVLEINGRLVLFDVLLGVGDGPIDRTEQPVAIGRFQIGSLNAFARFFQHRQRFYGVLFTERAGIAFAMCKVSNDLAQLRLANRGGLVGRRHLTGNLCWCAAGKQP